MTRFRAFARDFLIPPALVFAAIVAFDVAAHLLP